jgi:short-subunit dehydrogenase
MTVLITGASSGIGRDIARALSELGHADRLILTARRQDRLQALANELSVPTTCIATDLREEANCRDLYHQVRDAGVNMLINNAGFGVCGLFTKTSLDVEMAMLDVNVRAMHILTKLFLRDFAKRNEGYILNVASAAAFLSGPLMAAYYADKAYVLRLTQGIAEELRNTGSRVYIGAFCPGPVRTEFDSVAGVRFSIPGISSERAAALALEGLWRGKTVIAPGVAKWIRMGQRLLPDAVAARLTWYFQSHKTSEGYAGTSF